MLNGYTHWQQPVLLRSSKVQKANHVRPNDVFMIIWACIYNKGKLFIIFEEMEPHCLWKDVVIWSLKIIGSIFIWLNGRITWKKWIQEIYIFGNLYQYSAVKELWNKVYANPSFSINLFYIVRRTQNLFSYVDEKYYTVYINVTKVDELPCYVSKYKDDNSL